MVKRLQQTMSDQDARRSIALGFYPDLSNADYHASEGYSSSQLKKLVRGTPAHLAQGSKQARAPSHDMLLGSVLHTLVLTPHTFADEFALEPTGADARSSRGRIVLAGFQKDCADSGITPITREILDTAWAMEASVKAHPIASALLADVIAEASVYWQHEPADPPLALKVRPDAVSRAHSVLVDLKTTEDGSVSGFQRSIQKYHYDLSAAMYMEGVNQCAPLLEVAGREAFEKFVFICVENVAPYLVSVYELSPEYMNLGRTKYRRALQVLQEGFQNGWPGYPNEVRMIHPPGYAKFAYTV